MIINVSFGTFIEYMDAATNKHYSLYALQYIFDYENEADPNYQLDPLGLAGCWDEYDQENPDALIYDHGDLTEAGGYSYLQIADLTEDEKEAAVEEIFEALQDRGHAVKLSNGNILIET